jgi:hypothetical protein
MVEERATFTLNAAPNLELGYDEVIMLAKEFDKDQQHEHRVFDELGGEDYSQYSSIELSGAREDDYDVRLSLFPSKCNIRGGGTERQLRMLSAMQSECPSIRIPSVLEAISYWFSLRALHDGDSEFRYDERITLTRHIDLRPVATTTRGVEEMGPVMPQLSIFPIGEPHLDAMFARGYHDPARAVVG